MDLEFDKEIDALLRQSARGDGFLSTETASHLDADAISAFAENALPEKIRQRYTLHLADCDKCRKNLSSLIRLNGEESSEIVHAAETHFVAAAAPPIPWYRRLVAFPSLAYAMGALVLIFSGIAVYVVLQSASSFTASEVSLETYDKQPGGKGMNSDGDQTAPESYSSNSATVSNSMMSNAMSNAAAMNSSSSAPNSSAVPSAPILTANSNAVMRESADKDLPGAPKPLAPANSGPTDLAKTDDSIAAGAAPAPAPPSSSKENNYSTDGEAERQQTQAQNSIAQQTELMPDSRNAKRAPTATQPAEGKKRKVEESRDDAMLRSKDAATATTSVGGKTFKRENNVWYDSAYRGQPTVNVTRGTNEYKKLDAGLRGIAENLGGTVVVVWKSRAYRIQ